MHHHCRSVSSRWLRGMVARQLINLIRMCMTRGAKWSWCAKRLSKRPSRRTTLSKRNLTESSTSRGWQCRALPVAHTGQKHNTKLVHLHRPKTQTRSLRGQTYYRERYKRSIIKRAIGFHILCWSVSRGLLVSVASVEKYWYLSTGTAVPYRRVLLEHIILELLSFF